MLNADQTHAAKPESLLFKNLPTLEADIPFNSQPLQRSLYPDTTAHSTCRIKRFVVCFDVFVYPDLSDGSTSAIVIGQGANRIQ